MNHQPQQKWLNQWEQKALHLRTIAERKLLQEIPAYTAYNKSAPVLSEE